MVVATWIVGDKAYKSGTPSRKDGIDLDSENRSRAKTVLFIEEMGLELQCNRIVVATASVFFHRFFALQSFKQHNRFVLGATCLFLAGKVEEDLRKLRDVVSVWMNLRRKRGEVVADSETKDVTNKILLAERILLQTLCFDLQVVHPFSHLLDLIKNLKDNIDQENKLELRQAAISFINDSLRSPLCLLHDARYIAVSGFYLATMHLNISPVNPNQRNIADQSWFELIENHIEEGLLHRICVDMLGVYGVDSPSNAFAQPPSSSSSSNGNKKKGKYDIHTDMTAGKAGELSGRISSNGKGATATSTAGAAVCVGDDDVGKGAAMKEGEDDAPPPPPSDSPDGQAPAKRARLD